MPSDTSGEELQRVQNALLVIFLSLSAIFLVKLYKARLRMIKLKNEGLVSHISDLCETSRSCKTL